jgi:hypothetical protein
VIVPEGFVGRSEELALVDEFLAGGRGSHLVLAGEAGIGKTTVWRAAIRRAEKAGLRVLTARPVEAEAKLAFSGLSDLFEDVPAQALDGLPAPQRRALAIALLRADPGDAEPDSRAVAAAVRTALVLLGPRTIVAIDDLQWLDASSAAALGFALRREPVRLIASRRPRSALPDGLDQALAGAATVELGPLGVDAIHELLLERLGRSLPRPLLSASTRRRAATRSTRSRLRGRFSRAASRPEIRCRFRPICGSCSCAASAASPPPRASCCSRPRQRRSRRESFSVRSRLGSRRPRRPGSSSPAAAVSPSRTPSTPQRFWLMVWPGLCILLTTLAFNLFGDGLRDAFDPRARI